MGVPSVSIRLTVVTVIRDDIPGLRRTMQSLAHQLTSEVEWLIVDGSVNDPVEKALPECLLLANVRVLCRAPLGIYDAMNFGVEHARGTWCWFINAGDILVQSDSLAGGLELIDLQGDEAVIGTSVLYLSHNGYLFSVAEPSVTRQGDSQSGRIHHQGAIIRTSVLRQIDGFRTDLVLTADGELIDRLLSKFIVSTSRKPLVGFFMGGASTKNFMQALRETNGFRPDYYSRSSFLTLRFKNLGVRSLLWLEGTTYLSILTRPYLRRRAVRVRSQVVNGLTDLPLHY